MTIAFLRERGTIRAMVDDGPRLALGTVRRTPSGPVVVWDEKPPTDREAAVVEAFGVWVREEK